MKKFLSLLMALALAALPLTAFAAPGDALLLRADGEHGVDLRGLIEVDGTVYMFTYNDELYTLAPGADAPERRAFQTPQPEEEDEGVILYPYIAAFIAYDGAPCVIVTETLTETEGEGEDAEYFSTCEGAWLYALAFDEEGNASVGEELVELDWFGLVQGNGYYENYAQCDRPFVADGFLYFTSYDESGNDIFIATDLADGDTDVYYPADLGMDARLEELCAYKDGLLLAMAIDYGENGNTIRFHAVDLEEETVEPLAKITPDGLSLIHI